MCMYIKSHMLRFLIREALLNAFEVLGVEPQSTPEEIKSAWRKLVFQNHPDRGGDAGKLIDVNRAFDLLKNPNRTSTTFKSYDDKSTSSAPPPPREKTNQAPPPPRGKNTQTNYGKGSPGGSRTFWLKTRYFIRPGVRDEIWSIKIAKSIVIDSWIIIQYDGELNKKWEKPTRDALGGFDNAVRVAQSIVDDQISIGFYEVHEGERLYDDVVNPKPNQYNYTRFFYNKKTNEFFEVTQDGVYMSDKIGYWGGVAVASDKSKWASFPGEVKDYIDKRCRAKLKNGYVEFINGERPPKPSKTTEPKTTEPKTTEPTGTKSKKETYKVYSYKGGRKVVRVKGKLYGTGEGGSIGKGKYTSFFTNDRVRVNPKGNNLNIKPEDMESDHSQNWSPIDEVKHLIDESVFQMIMEIVQS